MASLLNNASLLLNPAGSIIAYEEDKIFSVLPSNGAGDFTFSGGDGGTRVNQQGYVEVTPANLFTYSNDFTNAVWGTGGYGNKATITPNALPNPVSGVLDASLANFISSGTQGRLLQVKTGLQVGIPYTVSMYVKAGTKSSVVVYVDTAALGYNADFNLSTGTITSTYGTTATIKLVDNGWYYITVTCPVLPSGNMQYGIITNGSDDGTLYLYGAMLNQGSIAKPYQPTTDRLNYPRITYQNGRGALMGELQRTNYALYSDTCAWTTQVGASLTFSSSISPDGTQNATTLNVGTGAYSGTYYFVNRGFEKAVVSIFAKVGTLPYLYFLNTLGNTVVAWYDLRNGTVSNVTAGYNAYMEPYKDGWYRCVLSGPIQNNVYIQIGATDVSGNIAASYAGNIYIWGGQDEVGTYDITYATSYIPTTTATVTRPSDIPYASGVSSLVGQSSGGTLYVSGVPRASEEEFAAITPGGYSTVDGVYVYYTSGNNLGLYVVGGSTIQIGGSAATINVGQYFKAAARYGNGSTAYYVNGKQIATTSAALAFTNTLNRIDLRGNAYYYSTPGAQEISTVATYPSGLTNTQLAELTTIRSGSGGNISYYGPYTIHTFTGSATFTPSFTGPVEVLVVAGGGGGGTYAAGAGGGAGGLLYVSSYGVSAGTGITVTVGAGGTGGNWGSVVNATQGSNSVFGPLNAIGGGRGGTGWVQQVGGNGGSGGGGGGYDGSGGTFTIVGGTGTVNQGNNGGLGRGISGNRGAGGGGGGAGQVGGDSTTNSGGNGGNGLPYSLSGFSTYYAGGGGGGDYGSSNGGQGGLGGGGNVSGGNGSGIPGFPGVPFTGGGGGGSRSATSDSWNGGNGGAGIVIIRYLT